MLTVLESSLLVPIVVRVFHEFTGILFDHLQGLIVGYVFFNNQITTSCSSISIIRFFLIQRNERSWLRRT